MPMNGSNICISVALITRSRPESLNRSLSNLRSQSVQPYEIIVSDDSDPELASQTEAVAKSWNCKYISGPRRGMQANRNCAHTACTGTHIRTMDDDHEFPEEHFKIIQELVESDTHSVWLVGEYNQKSTDPSIMQLPGEVQPRGFRKLIVNYNDCYAISDGSAIYPRNIINKHKFWEYFKYAGELEFGARLQILGYRIRYFPRTYIIHISDAYHDPREIQVSSFIGSYLTYAVYKKKL